jgi:hypothetical protein
MADAAVDVYLLQAAMGLPPLALRVISETVTQQATNVNQQLKEKLLHACSLILKAGHIAMFSPRFAD